MTADAEPILQNALHLTVRERAEIADRLLQSLEPPQFAHDEEWAKVAEDRMTAFETGRIKALSEEEVMADLESL